MNEYHKINNIYRRDTVTNKIVQGEYFMPEFAFLADKQWIATEKIDGTNVRVIWDGTDLSFKGKTDNAQFHPDLIKRLEELFNKHKNLFAEKFGEKPVCLYGEGYGAGIQKGGVYKQTKDFILFDVMVSNYWLERGNVEGIAEMLGIEVVPVTKMGTLPELVDYIKTQPKSKWGDFVAEGIVARPATELRTRFGDRIITKIKVRDF